MLILLSLLSCLLVLLSLLACLLACLLLGLLSSLLCILLCFPCASGLHLPLELCPPARCRAIDSLIECIVLDSCDGCIEAVARGAAKSERVPPLTLIFIPSLAWTSSTPPPTFRCHCGLGFPVVDVVNRLFFSAPPSSQYRACGWPEKTTQMRCKWAAGMTRSSCSGPRDPLYGTEGVSCASSNPVHLNPKVNGLVQGQHSKRPPECSLTLSGMLGDLSLSPECSTLTRLQALRRKVVDFVLVCSQTSALESSALALAVFLARLFSL